MNLKPIASNMTEVETNRYIILFSYATPVAYYDKVTGNYHETNEFWSVATSKHITKWIISYGETRTDVIRTEQNILNNLLNDVK